MAVEYSVQIIRELEEFFFRQKIIRPLRVQRYDPGKELVYDVQGLAPARKGQVRLKVEKFVGGGYAGQVYCVKALEVKAPEGPISGLQAGQTYAMKILIPPTGFSRWYRNFIYALAFQGPFSPQVNPAAARAGALWQKLIRQGAKLRLGSEKAIVDIYATFVDPVIGSCGEISEWVNGRMWRFEVDDNLQARRKGKGRNKEECIGSPEYITKRRFMLRLVQLMHEMGAVELARQYEWWTCKSQPNALKRLESDPNSTEGLVAVDFRAGLALLPFLPMCPADFKLILQGILRGSLVQFDRGDIEKLQGFVKNHKEIFVGMSEAVQELKEAEISYRNSLPDIAHHHIKLIYSPKLWISILKNYTQSLNIRNIIDDKTSKKLQQHKILALLFCLLGLIPFLGNFLRRLLGRPDYRHHYRRSFTSLDYLRRTVKSRIAETLIRWHRKGRIDVGRTKKLVAHPLRFFAHLPFSLLPAKIHRFFTDRQFFMQSLDYIFARPIRLYFKAEAREQWLRQMISQGQKNGMLTKDEATHITSQIKEPFIQKYLKCLAVHVCTVPVTQIVSVLIAIIYIKVHPELSWQEASLHAGIILGLFQVTPISPGSIARGLYVTALVLKERSLKNYNIAFYLSFLKYIGYLAFPIQMAYRYPDIARFMAGHWATGVVHIVPIFGERGALLEHAVFDVFYNYPLSIRRRIRERKKLYSTLKPRHWHLPLYALGGAVVLAFMEVVNFHLAGHLPKFGSVWWLFLWVPVFGAGGVSAWAGGVLFSRRIAMGAICGALIGLLHAGISTGFSYLFTSENSKLFSIMEFTEKAGITALWRIFLYAIFAIIAAYVVETRPLKQKEKIVS